MHRREGLGYDPGPVGESHTRLGPPTRKMDAAPVHLHRDAEAGEHGWPCHQAVTEPQPEEHF